MNRFSHLPSQFSEGKPLADDLGNGKIEAASIIKVFAIVETEHLFVKVTEQMKRLYTHVSSRHAALEKRPEILKAVGVYATII